MKAAPPDRTPGAEATAPIASFFDDLSTNRNEFFRAHPVLDYEQLARARAVLRMVAAARGETILDIGCGNARDIIPLLQAGADVIGVDLSAGMIKQAARDLAAAGHQGVRLEVGDATQLRFAAETFDKVVCSEVIEHIPDAASAVKEIHRVLKPGGTVIVSTPNRGSWYGLDRFVYEQVLRRRWNHPFDNWRTMRELQSLLESHGFTVATLTTACYVPGFLLTYFLPVAMQRILVRAVSAVEGRAAAVAPRRGYLLVVAATKR